MQNIPLCLVFVLIIKTSCAINDNYNFTYAMASRCKQYIARHGYNYDTFYHIDEANLQHATVKRDRNDVTYFEMHIAIQAPSNGHILLSPVPKPGPSDSVYEIVVGGGGNKFTELRLNLKRNARRSLKTTNILSTIEFTAFYIKISDDGLVEFGKEGDTLPIISYYDAHTLPIKYFSFASWTGVEAKFLFDCPSADDDSTPDSQIVEPKLSNSDELKRNLLMSKLPSIAPSPTVLVQLSIRLTHIKYDALDSKLKTRLAVVMSWSDNGMAWNPSKFNGTTSLKFRQGQIWRPLFFVFNADSIEPFDAQNPDLISVVYNGDATFHFQDEVNTWCMDIEETNMWPHDEYSCSLVIEPWELHEKIAIEIMEQSDNKLAVFADIDEVIESEWEVASSEVVIKPFLWNMAYTNNDDNETHQSDRYVLNLHIKRRATTSNIVFYTPLYVLLVFVLMSFWGDVLELSRLWFYTGCVIVICMGLSNIDFLLPTHTVPSILVLYITVLSGVLLAMLVQVFLMTSLAEKLCKTSFMHGLLTFSLLRKVFCMPAIKVSLSGEYSRQEDVDEGAFVPPRSDGSVEEMDCEETKYGDKREFAEVVDKIMFVVYSVTAAVMLASHY